MLLNTLEVSTSKVFLDSYANKDKFVSVNNMLREQKEMKEKVKNPENAADYISKKKETYYVSCKKNSSNKHSSFKKTKQNRLMLG